MPGQPTPLAPPIPGGQRGTEPCTPCPAQLLVQGLGCRIWGAGRPSMVPARTGSSIAHRPPSAVSPHSSGRRRYTGEPPKHTHTRTHTLTRQVREPQCPENVGCSSPQDQPPPQSTNRTSSTLRCSLCFVLTASHSTRALEEGALCFTPKTTPSPAHRLVVTPGLNFSLTPGLYLLPTLPQWGTGGAHRAVPGG